MSVEESRDAGENCVGFSAELVFTDPANIDFGGSEIEVTVVLALERVAGPMRLESVEFDAEAELWPIHVDLMPDLIPSGGRARQACSDQRVNETPLELRASECRGPIDRQGAAETLRAMMPAVALDHGDDFVEVE